MCLRRCPRCAGWIDDATDRCVECSSEFPSYRKKENVNQNLKCLNCFTSATPGVPCPACGSTSRYDDTGALVWTVGEPYAPTVAPRSASFTPEPPPTVDREDKLPDALLDGGEDSPVVTMRAYEPVPRPAGKPWRISRQVTGEDLDSILAEPDAPRLPTVEAHRCLVVGPDLDSLFGGQP